MTPEERAKAISLELAENWNAPLTDDEMKIVANHFRQAIEDCARIAERYKPIYLGSLQNGIAAAIRATKGKAGK